VVFHLTIDGKVLLDSYTLKIEDKIACFVGCKVFILNHDVTLVNYACDLTR
jgi:hypothetical protein